MRKTQVALLRGGPSHEHDVSMQTGASVIGALLGTEFEVHDIIITRTGSWIENGFEKQPYDALARIDVVFNAMHGQYGEDGTVQRILDRLSIPYTGSKAFASAVAMNKLLTKEHLKNAGIKMAPHMRVRKDTPDLYRLINTIESLFGPEYVIKPLNSGSSIGVVMATAGTSFQKILREMLEVHDELLIEQRLYGKEATVGVIENFRGQSIYSLPVIEIIPPSEAQFFDHANKYNGKTEEICPGRFSRSEKSELENIAKMVHRQLELNQYSRSDFIVTKDGVYFLEVNTLPGLTGESLMPKSLNAVGCNYQDFVIHLINDALGR